MNFKKIIALILAVFMIFSPITSFTGVSFADDKDYVTVEISGEIDSNDYVSFLSEKDGKRYYIDSIKVEDDGTYLNSFEIPKGIEAIINVFANEKTFSFKILSDNTISIESEGHDFSQVEFQYNNDKFSIEIDKRVFYSGSDNPGDPGKYRFGNTINVNEKGEYVFENGLVVSFAESNVAENGTMKVSLNEDTDVLPANKVDKIGDIIDISFENIDFNEPIAIKTPIVDSINREKVSVYEFDLSSNSWKALDFHISNDSIIGYVDGSSTVSVFEDEYGPENLSVSCENYYGEKVIIKCSATDFSSIKEYKLYKDDFKNVYATSSDGFFEDTNIDFGETYIYKIKAIDKYGNVSEFSDGKSITIEGTGNEEKYKIALKGLVDYQIKNVSSPGVGSVGGDWAILGLARNETEVPGNYYENYYRKVESYVTEEAVKENSRFNDKVTDVERLILAITSIGKDPRDVNGVNLLDFIWNKEGSFPGIKPSGILGERQGANELIFGLLALDTKNYEKPDYGTITREDIISNIVTNYQLEDGSISLSSGGTVGSFDISAMALQALAPYYDSNAEAKTAIDKIISYLANCQGDDGTFTDSGFGTGASSESCSQAITGLSAVGIDLGTDERFIKNGNSAIDGLLLFRNNETGGFSHSIEVTDNQMASDQALYALVAYDRLVNEKTSLYNMSDVEYDDSDDEIVQKEVELGSKVELEGSTIYHFGDVVIDTTSVSLGSKSKLKVSENTSIEIADDSELEKSGPIINFEFEDVTISSSVEISLPVTDTSLANKSSIYYYDEENNKWKYVKSELKDGKLSAKVEHFSTYGVLADNLAPINPKGIIVFANENGIKLGFAAEDGSYIKAYDIYRDDFDDIYERIYDDFYVDSSITLGQTYTYKVKAVDVFNNISDFSSKIIVTPSKEPNGGDDEDNDNVSVYIRVIGYDGELISRRLISVGNFGLDEYLSEPSGSSATESDGWEEDKFPNGPTHAHALIKALESSNISYKMEDYGWSLYVSEINGESEFDIRSSSGWMYDVNGSLPNVGSQARYLNEYDDVTWYFSTFGYENLFPKLTLSKSKINKEDGVVLTLINKRKNKPIEDAVIIIDGEESQYRTNSEGKATLYFDEDGTYVITARHTRDGLYDMFPPNVQIVEVGNSSNSGGGSSGGGGGGKASIATQYTEEYSVIRKKDSSEQQVIDALNNVRDKIYGKMLKIETVEEASKLSEDVLDASNLINWSVDKIVSKEAAKETFNLTNDLMSSISKAVKVLMTNSDNNDKAIENSLMATKANTDNVLKTIDVILKEDNESNIDNLLESFTSNIRDIKSNISEKSKFEMSNLLTKSVIEFLDTNNRVQSKVKEDGHIVVFDKDTMDTIKTVNERTSKIAEKLISSTSTDVSKKINSKMTLSVESENPDYIYAYIDKGNLKTSGISESSAIFIETSIGSIEIPSELRSKAGTGQIKASFKKIEREDQVEPIKSFVKNDSQVIDFELSLNKEEKTRFSNPIQVSIPYESGETTGKKIVVYYANPDGRFEKIAGIYDSNTNKVTFKTNHLSKFFVKAEKVGFDDVESKSWAGNSIETLEALGIVTGKDEYNFMPEEKVTRAEFAAMLDRLVTIVPEKSQVENKEEIYFKDVSEDQWYSDYVYEICSQGWMNGKGDGRFDPNGYVTIQEISSVMSKIVEKYGYIIYDGTENYVEEECSDWAKPAVGLIKQLGFSDNLAVRGFKPLEQARRDEVAVMLNDLMKILIEE